MQDLDFFCLHSSMPPSNPAKISKDSMNILVNSLVLSNLKSMVAVWGSEDHIHLKSIKKILKSAAKLVLNKRSSDPISKDIIMT
jgi:hypothetical protein